MGSFEEYINIPLVFLKVMKLLLAKRLALLGLLKHKTLEQEKKY